MNSNFDLNIKNYTTKELEEIFELPTNYDESIVEIKETKMRQNILSDRSIVSSTKTNTLSFISQVKNALINNIKNNKTPNGGNMDMAMKIEKLDNTYRNIYKN